MYRLTVTGVSGSLAHSTGAVLVLAGPLDATLTAPVPGSTLAGSSATFSWSAGVAGVTAYWLDIGNSPGSGDLYGGQTTSTSQTVLNLPTDGRTLYVRLWTQINGDWGNYYIDYTFTASQAPSNQPPTFVSVAPSSGSGFIQTFAPQYSDPNGGADIRWAYFTVADSGFFNNYSCNGMYDAQNKRLYLLSTDGVTWLPAIHAGQNESQSNQYSCTLSGLGAGDTVNGRFLTARFAEIFNSTWTGYKDLILLVYDKGGLGTNWSGNGQWALGHWTAGGAYPVTLLSPANGAVNQPASGITLSWAASAGATGYDVYLGTANPPPYVGSTAGTSYTATGLTAGAQYDWYVVAITRCPAMT